MSAREIIEKVDRERLERLRPVLVEGESPVAMVPAQCVRIAEQLGRGGGEGVLHLTNLRLVFIDDRMGPAFHIPLREVEKVATNRIIAPGMRALNVTFSGQKETFWTGKRFAALMENAVALNR
jgi:hypothetical protein